MKDDLFDAYAIGQDVPKSIPIDGQDLSAKVC